MALINCPECEKEISDKAKECPHCGYNVEQKRLSLKMTKKLKFILLSIITVSIIVGGTYYYFSNQLSLEEKIAIDNVKDLKQMLKDSDSLKLNQDVLVIWYTDKDGHNDFYTYINYGAKNGYGAMGKDIAMYKGYKYYGDFEDIEQIDLGKDSEENLERKMELLSVQLPYLSYKVTSIIGETPEKEDIKKEANEKINKTIWVNKDKIIRKID
jgi:hypothetical protein